MIRNIWNKKNNIYFIYIYYNRKNYFKIKFLNFLPLIVLNSELHFLTCELLILHHKFSSQIFITIIFFFHNAQKYIYKINKWIQKREWNKQVGF